MGLRAIASRLLDSLGRAGHLLAGVLAARLEMLSTEIAEERTRLMKLVLAGLAVVSLLQAGVVLALLFLVLLVGPEHRLTAVGTGALVLLCGGLAGGLWMQRWLRSRPPAFAKSIAELRQDVRRLESAREVFRGVTGKG